MRSTGPTAAGSAPGARAASSLGGRIRFSKLFLLIFVFVFCVTLIYALATASISTGIIRQEAFNNSTAYLEKVSNLMENRINGIGNSWIRLCNGLDAQALDEMIPDPYGRYRLQKDMDSFASAFPGVDSMYFFFAGGRSVFFNSYTTTINYVDGTDAFFDKDVYYDFIKGDKLFAIYGTRRISPVFNIGARNKLYDSDVLTMVRRFPVNAADSQNLTALNIKADYFLQVIDENYMPKGSIVLVSSPSGQVMLTCCSTSDAPGRLMESDRARLGELREENGGGPFNMDIGAEKCSVTELTADTSGRIYTLIVPEKLLLASVSRVNLPIFLLINVIFVLSVVFSKLMEMRFYNPILRILNLLRSNGEAKPPAGNEFKQIDGYINRMLDDSARQQKQLQNYFALYRERILLALLAGGDEGRRLLEENDIAVAGDYRQVCALVVRLSPGDGAEPGADPADLPGRVADTLSGALKGFGQAEKVRLDRHRACLLLFLQNPTDPGALKETIRALPLVEKFRGELRPGAWRLSIGVGGVRDSIKAISQSFAEAEECLAYARQAGGTQVLDRSDCAGPCRAQPAYPCDEEEKILSDIEQNDIQALREDVGRFFAPGQGEADAKGARKRLLLLMCGASRRLGTHGMKKERDRLLGDALEASDRLATPEAVREWAQAALEGCMPGVRQGSINNRELIEKVEKYLGLHFSDDINLNTIAGYVHLSPSYLGKLFREISGCTFTDCLMRVRMEEAARLLIRTDARITDIVEKAGYLSIQSFNRAFRGYFDCSPSDYRKRHAGRALEED